MLVKKPTKCSIKLQMPEEYTIVQVPEVSILEYNHLSIDSM